jgi:serine/threonine protein kinase
VTAYVDGPALSDAVARRGPLPSGEVMALAAGLAEGLEAIHAAGVVHRDLKPSNVLLAADGPRIIDFGISRAMDAATITRTGWVAGSPGFMSPEQARGEPTGPASDIFSLGSLLVYAATSQSPFGEGLSDALLYRVVHAEPDTTRLAPQVRGLVEACLAKDPRQRPTAAQLVATLGGGQPGAAWFPWGTGGVNSAPPPSATVPQGVPARGPAAVPTAAPQARAGGNRRGGWAWTLGISGGVAAIAALVIGLALSLQSKSASSSPAAATSGAQSHGTLAASGSSSGNSTSTSPSLAGWAPYSDPGHFSIKLPPGWSVSSVNSDEVRFNGPALGEVALVAWTYTPQPDAYADWQNQAASHPAGDPTYQQVSITRVSYRGLNSADWEFEDSLPGVLTHYLDRAIIVSPGQLGFAIELEGPQPGWQSLYGSVWNGLTESFQPAS